MWYTYILRCNDRSLYTWVTTDLQRRERQHNWELKGWAKYTRAKRPVKLVYFEEKENKSEACKRESEIKKLSKLKKEDIIKKRI